MSAIDPAIMDSVNEEMIEQLGGVEEIVVALIQDPPELLGDVSDLADFVRLQKLVWPKLQAPDFENSRVEILLHLTTLLLGAPGSRPDPDPRHIEILQDTLLNLLSEEDLMLEDDSLGKAIAAAIISLLQGGLLMYSKLQDRDQKIAFLTLISSFDIAYSLIPLPSILMLLGIALWERYSISAKLDDIDEAIEVLERALSLLAPDDPERRRCLDILEKARRLRSLPNNLSAEESTKIIQTSPFLQHQISANHSRQGNALINQFSASSDVAVLDKAITSFQLAVSTCADYDPARGPRIGSLGIALSSRFQLKGDLADLDAAILHLRRSVDLTPQGSAFRFQFQGELGRAYSFRYRSRDKIEDLQLSVSLLKEAVESTHEKAENEGAVLHHLGEALRLRFQSLGDIEDLNHSIEYLKSALSHAPRGDTMLSFYHSTLAEAYCERFKAQDKDADSQNALDHHRKAFEAMPPDFAVISKIELHSAFGRTLSTRYYLRGSVGDLDDAILQHSIALTLVSEDHPRPGGYYNNMGSTLLYRYYRFGDLQDLRNAATNLRLAIELTPESELDRQSAVGNYADCLVEFFKSFDTLEDLNEAIVLYQDVLRRIPQAGPSYSVYLGNLAEAFRLRFKRLGDREDIDSSIAHSLECLSLISEDHHSLSLSHDRVGIAYKDRYDKRQDLDDLNESVYHHQRAIAAARDGRATLPYSYSNLGNALLAGFGTQGDMEDLDQAIIKQHRSLDLTPDDDPKRYIRHINLGDALLARFLVFKRADDIKQAIYHKRITISLLPPGHSYEAAARLSLAGAVSLAQGIVEGSYEEMIDMYRKTATMSSGDTQSRFTAAKQLTDHLLVNEGLSASSTFLAYGIIMTLLPRLSWIGVNVETRFQQLYRSASIASTAASVALANGRIELALEWLEQGRSVVWAQILQLRSPLDQLEPVKPEITKRLRQIWAKLEDAGSTTATNERERPGGISSEERIKLATESEKLIAQVRKITGFERFLLPKRWTELREAARSGPVIVLTASEYRSDALVLSFDSQDSGKPILHNIPLDGCTMELLRVHQRLLQNAIRGQGFRAVDLERALVRKKHPGSGSIFETVLGFLWSKVVEPCLTYLKGGSLETDPNDELLRIHWCSSGPFVFFPLHAAGRYTLNGRVDVCLSDFAISSYTPTLGALLTAQAQTPTKITSEPSSSPETNQTKMLAVVQEHTAGQASLPGTIQELRRISDRTDASDVQLEVLQGNEATPDSVIQSLPAASIVHFACHGTQNVFDPLRSGLLLHGGLLDLARLTETHLPHARLAFLSACETATGDEDQPDEAIHFAAGMLAAGFKSVIATMWTIPDTAAPLIADEVYRRLFEGQSGTVEIEEGKVAEALHFAVGKLRNERMKKGLHGFMEWIPFIHLGA